LGTVNGLKDYEEVSRVVAGAVGFVGDGAGVQAAAGVYSREYEDAWARAA
jgi:hypothetical protein